jgi:hypothetical protein
VISADTFNNSLEKALDQRLDVFDFADLNNLLKLGEE